MKLPWSDMPSPPPQPTIRAPEATPTDDDRHKLDIARVARGIALRRLLILKVAAVIFVVLGLAVFLGTAGTYSAEARMLTRSAREVLAGTPLASGNLPDANPDAMEETVGVRPVLERAAAALGDISPEDLSDAIYIDSVPRSRIVLIGATSKDPVRAAAIANATANAFLSYQTERFRLEVANAEELLKTRAADARGRLGKNQEELATFAASKGLFDPDTEISSLLEETTSTETQIRAARTALLTARSRLDYVKTKRSGEPATITTTTTAPPARAQIAELEAKRRSLLARYTPEHPLLQELDAQIEILLKEEKANRRPTVQSTTQEANPIYQQLYLTEVQTEIEVRSSEAQLGALERTRDELSERARTLPTLRAELTQLTIERRAAETTLDDTLLNLARVQELRGGQTPLYEIIEEAQTPVAPQRGRTMLGLVLVAAFSLVAGFGVALVAEVRDDRVRDVGELEALGATVLGSIPPEALNPARHEEAMRQLAFAVRRLCVEGDRRCILVTSAIEREHKSAVARGISAAMTGWLRPIVRIDANLRDPDAPPGSLDAWLRGELEHAPVGRGGPGLGIILGGHAGNQAPALLSDARMDELLASVRESFRVGVIDGPALLASVDAEILAEKVDGVLLVVRAFHTPRPRVAAAISRLRAGGSVVLGAVLTDARSDDRRDGA